MSAQECAITGVNKKDPDSEGKRSLGLSNRDQRDRTRLLEMVAYAIVGGDAVYRAVDISEGMKGHPRDAQPETVATRQDDGSVGAIGLCQQRRYETTTLPGRQVRNERKNA